MPDLDLEVAIPLGGILQWSGLLANIPSGFALCDGQGGRPDLRSRFIRGAPASTDPGGTGGSDTVVLVTSELPTHNHSFSQSAHTHDTLLGSGAGAGRIDPGSDSPVAAIAFQNNTSGITINNNGSDNAHENRPAYYELAFIIKE